MEAVPSVDLFSVVAVPSVFLVSVDDEPSVFLDSLLEEEEPSDDFFSLVPSLFLPSEEALDSPVFPSEEL